MVSNFSLHHTNHLASKQKTKFLQPFPSLSLLHHQSTTTPDPKSDSCQANNTQPPSKRRTYADRSNFKLENRKRPQTPSSFPPDKSDVRRKFRAITSLPPFPLFRAACRHSRTLTQRKRKQKREQKDERHVGKAKRSKISNKSKDQAGGIRREKTRRSREKAPSCRTTMNKCNEARSSSWHACTL